MTADEVARALGVSPQRVRTLGRDGKLDARRDGPRGGWTFSADAVRAKLEGRQSDAPPRPADARPAATRREPAPGHVDRVWELEAEVARLTAENLQLKEAVAKGQYLGYQLIRALTPE